MANITVRDIPDGMYERLKEKSERDRRSLNAEVIVAIDRLLDQDDLQERRTQALQRIIERRKRIPVTDIDSVELLREDRQR